MDEVRSRALRFIRLEEDREIQKRVSIPCSYDNPNRMAESSTQRSYNSKPYFKHDHHKISALDDEGEEDEFLKITDYFFTIDVSSLMLAI